ncbi:MAG TPA: sulfurtransferase TusA family protein [Nitriliruptorales bacterium]
MNDDGSPTRTLDTLGAACPVPIIELARAVDELEVGDVVEVLSDDPGAKVDVPVWCRMQRQAFRGQRDLDRGGWSFLVQKTR